MRWEFTQAATRALLQVQATIPNQAGLEWDSGLELLAALTEDPEGSGVAWLHSMGVDGSTWIESRLPTLLVRDASLLQRQCEECSHGKDLLRLMPLSLTGLLRSARHFASEQFCDPTINSEALLAAVFERSPKGKRWLLKAGFHSDKASETLFGPALHLEEPLDLDRGEIPMGWIRLVDAVGNRLREGLRVLEDFYRFVKEDRWLVERLKRMRHQVDTLLVQIPGTSQILDNRDVEGDSGAGLWTGSERPRKEGNDLQRSNWKRVQEAFRSIEEHAKLAIPGLSRQWEGLRYEAYTLEKKASGTPSSTLSQAAMMLLVSNQCLLGLERTVREAIRGGVDMIQLREKNLPDRELLALAKKTRQWTRDEGALFILNDRPDLAVLSEADGVHLGTSDIAPAEARRIVGKDSLIGASSHNVPDREAATMGGADYLGVGPMFPSKTKAFQEYVCPDYLHSFADWQRPPWFAIGGINLETIDQVRALGAVRIAISNAICQSEDPQAMARALRLALGIGPRK